MNNTTDGKGGGIFARITGVGDENIKLIISGGEISGNKAKSYGGGIYTRSNALISGGTITANTAGNVESMGSGVYQENHSRIEFEGTPVITGNAAGNGKADNLTLNDEKVSITGTLTSNALVGVNVWVDSEDLVPDGDGYVVFTTGLKGNGSAANFFSDSDDYLVALNADGEAMLETAHTVTFEPGDESATGYMPAMRVGSTLTLPACDYSVEGKVFKEWSVKIGNAEAVSKQPDETIEITADTTVTAVWEEVPTVIIKSANVEFQGLIRLQFTFTFPAEVLTDEGSYLTFEKAGTTTTRLVSEGSGSGEDLCFMISVPAPEYADDITIKVYDSEGRQLTLKSSKGTDYTENGFVYSVKAYAQKMSVDGSTEQMRRLAKALDDYGAAAQIYFTYGDYSSLSVDSAVTAVTLEDLAPYALTTSGTRPAGVTGAGIMVEFESDNTLRITFKTDGSKPLSDYTFLLDDVEATPTKSGKNAYLQVVNIAAPNLDTAHSFTVSDGTDTYTITASALSYAYTSVKNGNAARQNLGKALYLYNQAANTRFGN